MTVSAYQRSLMYILFLLLSSVAFASDEFPGRAKYMKVPFIELAEAYAERESAIIIDVRSKYEYDTLRIKAAINIPISDIRQFESDLSKLREENPTTKLIFYCNGKTCMKSYKATMKAMQMGLENVYAYDAGVFDWAKAYPGEAALLGRSPIKPEQLISKASLNEHMLEPEAFSNKMTADSAVIDVRDRFQREGVGFFPGNEFNIPLDEGEKLAEAFAKAKQEQRPIFIYDAVGKQVRWLQYTLEDVGVQEYYFMKGGAKAYYDWMTASMWKK